MKRWVWYLSAVLNLAVLSPASGQTSCDCTTSAGITVRIVDGNRDKYELYDQDGSLVYSAHVEAFAKNDGHPFQCSDVISTSNLVSIKVGRAGDGLHVYGLQRGADNKILTLRQLIYNPRESLQEHRTGVVPSGGPDNVGVMFGRLSDVRMSICWGPAGWTVDAVPNFRHGRYVPCNTNFNGVTSSQTNNFWNERILTPYSSTVTLPRAQNCSPVPPPTRYVAAIEISCDWNGQGTDYGSASGIISASSEISCDAAKSSATQLLQQPTVCSAVVANGRLVSHTSIGTASCP